MSKIADFIDKVDKLEQKINNTNLNDDEDFSTLSDCYNETIAAYKLIPGILKIEPTFLEAEERYLICKERLGSIILVL